MDYTAGVACSSIEQCGRRQVCGAGVCMCPVKFGLVGYPDCRQTTPVCEKQAGYRGAYTHTHTTPKEAMESITQPNLGKEQWRSERAGPGWCLGA